MLGFALSVALHGALLLTLTARELPPTSTFTDPSSQLFGETFEIRLEAPTQTTRDSKDVAAFGPPTESSPLPVASRSSAVPEAPTVAPSRKTPVLPSAVRPSSDRTPNGESAPSSALPVERSSGAERGGDEARPTSGGSAAYGREGTALGKVRLLSAFAKTLPLAAKLFRGWTSAPLGVRSSILVELLVAGDGRLERVSVVHGDARSLLAQTAVKNEDFLRAGRFALREEGAGRLLVSLSVVVEARPPAALPALDMEDALDGTAEEIVALGQRLDPARATLAPTGVYFTYGSGRHVEISIEDVTPL